MSKHARAADAAYLMRLERAKLRAKPIAPIGDEAKNIGRTVADSDRACPCCGYLRCSRQAAAAAVRVFEPPALLRAMPANFDAHIAAVKAREAPPVLGKRKGDAIG